MSTEMHLHIAHDSLSGMSSFELVHGYAARTSFHWDLQPLRDAYPGESTNRQDVLSLFHRIHNALGRAGPYLQCSLKSKPIDQYSST